MVFTNSGWSDVRQDDGIDHQTSHINLQWLQDPSEINGDNLSNDCHEASRHFRTEGITETLIEWVVTNSRKKNIRGIYNKKQTNKQKVFFSPQANYTDWATAAAGEVVSTLRKEGVARSTQPIHTAVNPSFIDRNAYLFFQITPHLKSRGLVNTSQKV
jgi:hypothetical protein